MRTFLTPREREILLLLSQDLTSRELAESLYISFETVKSHRRNLLNKLGTKTTAGMVRKGFELGFLEVQ
ncbi:MAG: helix-turn-helix transcriptional regulator [Saprospiraceae bacterium]|nr:helix-turn-helix transcriptional regulator [Saprospiraceae bacterium]